MIESDSQGKGNSEEQGGHAVNSPSHQPDKLSSLPPATMLPLNSKRRVGLTNSSLYPPRINHSTELEWDTDFSRMKSWGGGWNTGNILNMSQLAEQGIAEHTPQTRSCPRAELSEATVVTWRIWRHRWNSMRYWICIDLFNRALNSLTWVSVLQRPSQITHVYGSSQILPKAMHLKRTAAYGHIFCSQVISLKLNYMTKCQQCLGH